MAPFIVGIRFQKTGKIYHFDATIDPDLIPGDYVVVDTFRGSQLGEVIQLVSKPSPPPEGSWKPIRRRATPRDLVMRQFWQKKELEATINCREKLASMNFPGVKIITSEFSFDGARLSFLYSTETEGKVELKQLRDVMQRTYQRSKVEMRQIGPRDVAKLLGGLGACGLDNRCCSRFLTDFSPISIKMAKEQGISLTPSEITGMCGRLRCCLIYEYEQYVEARKSLPKRNKLVVTPQGEGKIIDIYPLKDAVVVLLENGNRVEFPSQDLQPWDELEALRRKSQEPCDHHGDGPCQCGKQDASARTTDSKESTLEMDDDISESETPARSTKQAQPAGKRRRSKQRSAYQKPRRAKGKPSNQAGSTSQSPQTDKS
jgi:cell fate regulator YaaT (PSP1 superfamily)